MLAEVHLQNYQWEHAINSEDAITVIGSESISIPDIVTWWQLETDSDSLAE